MEDGWEGLAALARTGDEEAFERLVIRFQRPLCAAIHPILRDWHLTQDVAQEAFVAAWRGLPELRDPRWFRTWLYTIARNLAVSRVRTDANRPVRVLHGLDETRVVDLAGGGRQEPLSGGPSPRKLSRVRRAILALPNEYGTYLVLRHVEGMSVREMSEVLGRPPSAVKAVLHRARVLARTVLRRAGLDLEGVLDET